MVGNLGRQRVEFLRPTLVLAVIYASLAWTNEEQPNGFVVSLLGAPVFGYWRRWRDLKKPPKPHFCKVSSLS